MPEFVRSIKERVLTSSQFRERSLMMLFAECSPGWRTPTSEGEPRCYPVTAELLQTGQHEHGAVDEEYLQVETLFNTCEDM